MSDRFDLAGKVALITGAYDGGPGIGTCSSSKAALLNLTRGMR